MDHFSLIDHLSRHYLPKASRKKEKLVRKVKKICHCLFLVLDSDLKKWSWRDNVAFLYHLSKLYSVVVSRGWEEPSSTLLCVHENIHAKLTSRNSFVQIPEKYYNSKKLRWTFGVWTSIRTLLFLMRQNDACLTIRVHVVAWHLWRGQTLLKWVCAITALIHCYNLLLRWCKWCVRCHHSFHSVRHYFCKRHRSAQSLLSNRKAADITAGDITEHESTVNTGRCLCHSEVHSQSCLRAQLVNAKTCNLWTISPTSGCWIISSQDLLVTALTFSNACWCQPNTANAATVQ